MKHIVGFSGGIDSQACARWVLNTDRGGRQANLLRVFADRPACESKYGLCE